MIPKSQKSMKSKQIHHSPPKFFQTKKHHPPKKVTHVTKNPAGGSLLEGLKHFIHNLLVGHDLFQENSKILRRKRSGFIVNFTQNRMNKPETTGGCFKKSSAFLEKIGFGRHFPFIFCPFSSTPKSLKKNVCSSN